MPLSSPSESPEQLQPGVHWFVENKSVFPVRCAQCHDLVKNYHSCAVCGIHAHSKCVPALDEKNGCASSDDFSLVVVKPPLPPETPVVDFQPAHYAPDAVEHVVTAEVKKQGKAKVQLKHHFVERTYKLGKSCAVCGHHISGMFAIASKCSRCSLTVHPACVSEVPSDGCEPWFKPLMKPSTETVASKRLCRSYPPIVAMVNMKSGGQQGAEFTKQMLRLLGPHQVCNLAQKGGPARIIEKFQHVPGIRFVVCGGDGTAGWVLQDMEKVEGYHPPVAIIPLGTGNDLARVLGWGPGWAHEPLDPILRRVAQSTEAKLDRWRCQLLLQHPKILQQPMREHMMCNYFSVGFDSAIAYDWHHDREMHPEKFKSRLMNKARYMGHGLKHLMNPALSDQLVLHVDGHLVTIPEKYKAIIVINICSYAGGMKLWSKRPSRFGESSFNDGLFEVVALTSPNHVAGIFTHTRRAKKLAQGSSLTMEINPTVREGVCMQVDGEPFKVTDRYFWTITRGEQSNVLIPPP